MAGRSKEFSSKLLVEYGSSTMNVQFGRVITLEAGQFWKRREE